MSPSVVKDYFTLKTGLFEGLRRKNKTETKLFMLIRSTLIK